MLIKSDIWLILNDWNYWNKPVPVAIPRKAVSQPFSLEPDLVLVIQGVRRCGKSTLLAQIMKEKNLDPQHCTFINLEDPRLSENLNYRLLDQIVDFAHEKNGDARRFYFFLDEIQNVEGWQKWLRLKTDRPGRDSFVITGSNASLLSGDLASVLTGRHMTLELFPFDWEEYQRARPEGTLEGYLQEGGFPRVLSFENPEALLREYFTDIIERDVRRHVAVRSTPTLAQLVKAVFESAGSELSQRKLAKLLGVSADTIGTYLHAGESAYIFLSCPYFTFSERQRMARNRKYYPIDLGLRNAVATKTGLDLGKKLETAVFLHLRRKYRQIGYWKQKGEVDLVVQDEKITPYQVSWDGPKPRHEKALEEFYEQFPQADKPVFITAQNAAEFFAG